MALHSAVEVKKLILPWLLSFLPTTCYTTASPDVFTGELYSESACFPSPPMLCPIHQQEQPHQIPCHHSSPLSVLQAAAKVTYKGKNTNITTWLKTINDYPCPSLCPLQPVPFLCSVVTPGSFLSHSFSLECSFSICWQGWSLSFIQVSTQMRLSPP